MRVPRHHWSSAEICFPENGRVRPNDYRFLARDRYEAQESRGAIRTHVRPHLISPFPAFVHLHALRSAKNPKPRAAKAAQNSWGFFDLAGIKGEHLEKTYIKCMAVTSSSGDRSTRNFSFNSDTVEVPARNTCAALSKARRTSRCPNTSPA